MKKNIKIDQITNSNYCKQGIFIAPRPLDSFYPLEKRIGNKFIIPNVECLSVLKQIKTTGSELVVFKKKGSKSTLKTLRRIRNDSGKIRHYTPAAQEWHNNIYSYNTNYTKLLPIADKNLMPLLNSYFNLFLKPRNKKIKRIAIKHRRLSANKVFVGKGELKHTNEKVVITSYLYNVEGFYLKNLLLKEARALFYPKKKLEKETSTIKGREVIKYNRRLTLEEFMILNSNAIWRMYICYKIFWKKYIKLIGPKILRDEEKNAKKLKGDEKKYYIKIIDRTKALFFLAFSSANDINTMFKNYLDPILELVDKKEEKAEKLFKFKEEVNEIKKYYNDTDKFIELSKKVYEKKLKWLTFLLMVNSVKKEKPFIQKLTALVKNIYNKEVEFNIVNLYKMHLNSDIYTQAVSLKLKNRDNKLFRVLTRSLSKIKLPNVNRISEKYYKTNRDEYLINKIRNVYVNSMFKLTNHNYSEDSLNKLLLGFFPSTDDLEIDVRKRSFFIKRPVSLCRYIIKTLKHTKLAGIRVEAKGRLTRRFTAAKSVFKVRWKGGLKNVDSSFKGLSVIMLRGDRKSNVQYSMLSSKNRNGAFAVKSWIGGK